MVEPPIWKNMATVKLPNLLKKQTIKLLDTFVTLVPPTTQGVSPQKTTLNMVNYPFKYNVFPFQMNIKHMSTKVFFWMVELDFRIVRWFQGLTYIGDKLIPSLIGNPSGQIVIFHQPRFPWNRKNNSLTKPRFGVRLCGVAIIWPESL